MTAGRAARPKGRGPKDEATGRMKIDAPGPVGARPATRRERASSSKAGDFARHIAGDAPASASAVGGNAPIAAGDPLLLLQGVADSTSEPAHRRARPSRPVLPRGLDEIRHGLLLGSIPRESLSDLARMARLRKENATDPRLAEVLGEIELRAEVELAKLGYEDERQSQESMGPGGGPDHP